MNDFNLDELLRSQPTEEPIPTTFEEWVEIHGEPEYLWESSPVYTKGIRVIDCETHEEPVDTDGIIYEDKKGVPQLDYKKFVDVFAQVNNCVYCNGVFFNPDGTISNQSIRRDIAKSLGEAGWKGRIDSPTNSIFQTLKDMYSVDSLSVDEHVIPLGNGDLHIGKGEWEFRHGEKTHTPYRLNVNYVPTDKPTPLFDKWLNDVFAPEDIPTVQDIMGYMLVPTTAAGEAFFIVGDGEAGKSGLGTILMGILGKASTSIETQRLVTKQFQVAEVEHKLMAYDDDFWLLTMTETPYI